MATLYNDTQCIAMAEAVARGAELLEKGKPMTTADAIAMQKSPEAVKAKAAPQAEKDKANKKMRQEAIGLHAELRARLLQWERRANETIKALKKLGDSDNLRAATENYSSRSWTVKQQWKIIQASHRQGQGGGANFLQKDVARMKDIKETITKKLYAGENNEHDRKGEKV